MGNRVIVGIWIKWLPHPFKRVIIIKKIINANGVMENKPTTLTSTEHKKEQLHLANPQFSFFLFDPTLIFLKQILGR